jgi:hypothetical protein
MWRNIDNKYAVSDSGEVINISSGRVLKQEVQYKGYCRVVMYGKHKLVHRLVAKEFIPNIDDKPQINHIDGNKKNNNVINLEWVTNKENTYHWLKSHSHSLIFPNAKLTIEQVKHLKNIMYNHTPQELANMFGIAKITVYKIKQGKLWNRI